MADRGLRTLRFDGGPEDGARLIQIRNAVGLAVDLLPDRCLDIGEVSLAGAAMAWVGANGIPRAGTGQMDSALGGLMCTCGFDHIRQPEIWQGRTMPLHGTMALRPTVVAGLRETAEGFEVRADARHGSLSGQSWHLARRVFVPRHRAEIVIEDRVQARAAGEVTPIMALYHVNLGGSLAAETARVTVAGRLRPDLPGGTDTTFAEAAGTGAYAVRVEAAEPDPRLRLLLLADGAQLPWLQFHRRANRETGLFCIEPATHDRLPRATLLAAEPPLDGTRQRHFRLTFRLGSEAG